MCPVCVQQRMFAILIRTATLLQIFEKVLVFYYIICTKINLIYKRKMMGININIKYKRNKG